MIRESENVTVNESVPRGRILDRNGNVIVDNASKNPLHIHAVKIPINKKY